MLKRSPEKSKQRIIIQRIQTVDCNAKFSLFPKQTNTLFLWWSTCWNPVYYMQCRGKFLKHFCHSLLCWYAVISGFNSGCHSSHSGLGLIFESPAHKRCVLIRTASVACINKKTHNWSSVCMLHRNTKVTWETDCLYFMNYEASMEIWIIM